MISKTMYNPTQRMCVTAQKRVKEKCTRGRGEVGRKKNSRQLRRKVNNRKEEREKSDR